MNSCSIEETVIREERVLKNGSPTDITGTTCPRRFLVSLSEKMVAMLLRRSFLTRRGRKGNPFSCRVYGSAVVTVVLDCLRGTYKIDRVLIVHELRKQALGTQEIDMAQMEGGVMQGMDG